MGFRHNHSGFGSSMNERRATERYRANGTTILIEWIDGEASRTEQASLKDLSLRGALAEAKSAPRPGTTVRIRMADDLAIGEAKATVARVSKVRGSVLSFFRRSSEAYHISLRFKGVCPYELFKAAIDGFVVESCVIERVDPHFDWA